MSSDRFFTAEARRFFVFVCAVCVLFVAIGRVAAQEGEENPAVSLTAEAGFDGFYKSEHWLPVTITLANNGAAVEGEVRLTTGSESSGTAVIYSSPISLPTQSNKRLTLFVFLPELTGRLSVQLVDERGRTIAEATTNTLTHLSVDALLYAVVGPDSGELAFLEGITTGRSDAGVAYLELSDMPETPAAWNALDVVIFNDVDTGELTAEQRQALEAWIGTGGALVVAGGPGWQKTAAGVADLLPVTVSGSQSLDDLEALAQATGEALRDPGPYVVATSQLQQGEAIYHQDGLPLLARRKWGRGVVFFLALDPNLAPLADWDGNEVLWEAVATAAPLLPQWALGAQNSHAATEAVTRLPSLRLPSSLALLAFLLLYVMAIGPVNYLVLKRLGRPEMAWLSMPLLVLLCSATTYLTGFQLRGNEIILNQMSLVFGQAESEKARVQTLLGVYSPRRATYDLTLEEGALARPFDRSFSTAGLAGSGRIGSVRQGSATTITDVRVDVSGVETFVVNGYQDAPMISGQATLDVVGGNLHLAVEVENQSDLTLTQAGVFYGDEWLALGDLAPGARASADATLFGRGAAGPGGTISPGFVPSGGYGSPLSAHYEQILGSPDYFNDRQLYPRYQLLESLMPNYGAPWQQGDAATLIAWSDEAQVDASLTGTEVETQATTLYFLELPLTRLIPNGD